MPADAASQETTAIGEIGAGQIWSRVAAVADRRVVRDELLLDEGSCGVCGVQAGNEGLHGDEARHQARQNPPSRPCAKRSHAAKYWQTDGPPTGGYVSNRRTQNCDTKVPQRS